MKPETPWQSAPVPRFASLKKDFRCDVVVIGGGITGLTAAYQLKQAGLAVCLLERDRLGGGDTALTTAHLTYVTDLRVTQLARTFGDQAAKLVWQAGELAIDVIEATIEKEGIDCDFRRIPAYLCGPLNSDKDETKSLRRDAETATRLGFPARFLEEVSLVRRPGVQFANQAKFHPLKYLAGLAKAIDGEGSKIFEHSEVAEVKDKPLAVIANGKRVLASDVVIATHVPLMGKTGLARAALFQTKIFPYTSYAIGAKLPKGLIAEASFWDVSDPYYYLRIDAGRRHDYAIFGGEDHKTGQEPQPERRFERLSKVLRTLIPQAQPDRRWSGQVIETNDGLPYIGEMGGQLVATGFAGNGMTFGTLAGLMARDAVRAVDNPWRKLFSVDRKKLRGGTWNYLAENVDYPYYYLKDRLTAAATSTRQVKRGEGRIVDLHGEKIACSRDQHGKLRSVSAYCTHMGCLVHWNGAEQTWDCPCHGSRFGPDGKVLAGPAETALKPASAVSSNDHAGGRKPKGAEAHAAAKQATAADHARRRRKAATSARKR